MTSVDISSTILDSLMVGLHKEAEPRICLTDGMKLQDFATSYNSGSKARLHIQLNHLFPHPAT